jgi:hypothetical protein
VQQVTGRAIRVNGKAAHVLVRGAVTGNISSVYTIGKEDPTSAESARALVIRSALCRSSAFLELPFAKAIWLPAPVSKITRAGSSAALPEIAWTGRDLNASQTAAVRSMMDDQLISLIHGGPGTGKTVQTYVSSNVTSAH